MACESCKKRLEKLKAFWQKVKTFMNKKTWGMPNWVIYLTFPVVLIIILVAFVFTGSKKSKKW